MSIFSSGGGFLNYVEYHGTNDSSGSAFFAPKTGWYYVEVYGAGGSSAGSVTGARGASGAGGGEGRGGWIYLLKDQVVPVTVGMYGAAGTAGNEAGISSASSFGSYITANPGGRSLVDGTPGAGGTGGFTSSDVVEPWNSDGGDGGQGSAGSGNRSGGGGGGAGMRGMPGGKGGDAASNGSSALAGGGGAPGCPGADAVLGQGSGPGGVIFTTAPFAAGVTTSNSPTGGTILPFLGWTQASFSLVKSAPWSMCFMQNLIYSGGGRASTGVGVNGGMFGGGGGAATTDTSANAGGIAGMFGGGGGGATGGPGYGHLIGGAGGGGSTDAAQRAGQIGGAGYLMVAWLEGK